MRSLLRAPEARILLASTWIALFCNASYWLVIAAERPAGALFAVRYFGGFLLLTIGLISLVLMLFAVGRAARYVLCLSLLIAAATNFFLFRYGVVFDPGMLTSIVETNSAEALELMSWSLLAAIVVLGLLPAILLWRLPLAERRLPVALLHRTLGIALALVLIAVPLASNQKEIFSVARNHGELRHLITPLNVFSASYVTARGRLEAPTEHRAIALDATHMSAATEQRKPIVHVLMIGETARAASFSLNGYSRNTNPELAQIEDVHFVAASSCGTMTAVSLPCMFSIQEHSNFDREASRHEDNLLDIAQRAGYHIVWVDNGNSCKGVCARVANRDTREVDQPEICPEHACYDEILVVELQNLLQEVNGDTLIVLHQLGSHGPAYFRRYPDSFRTFLPDCRSANFADCSQQEIANSYDNTIAYTDHVIASAVDALSAYSDRYDTSLLYVSDHGESLGEHNMYLHGMPYSLAPAEQTVVPMIAWLGDREWTNAAASGATCFGDDATTSVSHDNLFHTELGLLDIATAAYRPELDILGPCNLFAQATERRELIM